MRISVKILLIAAAILLLAGCSKLNKENYGKLKMGMEYNEVTGILGSPDNCTESMGTKSCIWGDEAKHIKVKFVGDKTALFSNTGLQ